ncbi:Hsp20/alpha crystallin family protein [Mucisphaera sp.]|uniref:Hsp20/alpha crystallin family protein n=1 Tax=Mucisphaera sp. TaxID=2913024 RepID=UPI003D147932
MDDLPENLWFRGDEACSFGSSWSPPINLFRTPGAIHVCLDVAGTDPASIEIEFEDGYAIIKGERPCPEPQTQAPSEQTRIETMEIDHGPFQRVIEIGLRIDTQRITQTYQHGLLKLTLPLLQKTTDQPKAQTPQTPKTVPGK